MKITITESAANSRPFVICNHWTKRGDDALSSFRKSGAIAIEEVELLRAAEIQVFHRGNERVNVTFSVTREHASAQASEVFILSHELDLPRQGRVEFEAESGRAKVWLNDAVLTITNCSFTGCSTTFEYQIMGGVFTKISPFANYNNMIA